MIDNLVFEEANQVTIVTLNRALKFNALNCELIDQLTEFLKKVKSKCKTRAIIIKAEGKHFCAGADLDDMRRMHKTDEKQNYDEAMRLATLYQTLNECPVPTIALTQGKSLGGGVGISACCDFVIAEPDSQYCFSEVKLGIIPATISPYVMNKIGPAWTRSYFLSAEMIDANAAHHCGLVYKITTKDTLLSTGLALAEQLKQNAPIAMAAAKQLVNDLSPVDEELIKSTAQLLAEIRASDEAQFGFNAFFDKQKPDWSALYK